MFQLRPGDKVGIISPSCFITEKDIHSGLDYLRKLGLIPVLGTHLYSTYRYMGGTPQQRVEDLHNFYQNPEIKAIFTTRGGAGAQKMLPLIDYELIRRHPKPIFGISDTTALQLALYARSNIASYTGFSLKYDFLNGEINPMVDESLRQIISGAPITYHGGKTIIKGTAEGTMIGGCLSLIRNLAGTRYLPDLTDKILLIEDVGEKSYHIDLMLEQLRQLPDFNKIKGIIFGQFANISISAPEDGTIDEILDYFCADLKIPMIKNFPYGHIPARRLLPIGQPVRLDAENCTLSF